MWRGPACRRGRLLAATRARRRRANDERRRCFRQSTRTHGGHEGPRPIARDVEPRDTSPATRGWTEQGENPVSWRSRTRSARRTADIRGGIARQAQTGTAARSSHRSADRRGRFNITTAQAGMKSARPRRAELAHMRRVHIVDVVRARVRAHGQRRSPYTPKKANIEMTCRIRRTSTELSLLTGSARW